MNITLVFAPFAFPNYVPLAPAALKSVLEGCSPEVRVRTLDLNALLFQRLARGAGALPCTACPSCRPDCLPPDYFMDAEALRGIFRTLRTPITSRTGFQSYVDAVEVLHYYYRCIRDCYGEYAAGYLREGRAAGGFGKTLTEDADRILETRPDIVGFSVFTLDNLLYSLALAAQIRKRAGTTVVLGGAMLQHLDAGEILSACPAVDYVCRGDGEPALRALVRGVRNEDIPNISYRKGGVVRTNRSATVKDLDGLPDPDFSDFDLGAYAIPELILPVAASRGCPWGRCDFCMYCGSVARVRDPLRVAGEIARQSRRYGARTFFFNDLSITPKTLERLSEAISASGISVRYGAYLRPEETLTRDILEKARASGLRWALLGVESVTQRLLDSMHKGTSARAAARIIADCRAAGVRTYIACIAGLPTQTERELAREISFMKEQDFPGSLFAPNTFRLSAGSKIAAHPGRFGISRGRREVFVKLPGGTIHRPYFESVSLRGVEPAAASRRIREEIAIPYALDFDRMSALLLGCSEFSSVRASRNLPGNIGKMSRARRGARSAAAGSHERYLGGIRSWIEGDYRKAAAEFGRVRARGGPFARRLALLRAECCDRMGDPLRAAVHKAAARRHGEAIHD